MMELADDHKYLRGSEEGQYFWKLDPLEEFEEAVYVVRMAKL